MQLILLTHPQEQPKETISVNHFFEAGLTRLHIHKPDLNPTALKDYIGAIDEKWHPNIVLHAYPNNLGNEHPLNIIPYKLKGIHQPERVRQEAMPLPDKFKVVSTSFHYINDMLDCKGDYEYLFISPVFNSISKQGYEAAFNLDDIKKALEICQHQVIALGGIAADKIEQAKTLGFYGVGVLGGVWNVDKPMEALKELLDVINV